MPVAGNVWPPVHMRTMLMALSTRLLGLLAARDP